LHLPTESAVIARHSGAPSELVSATLVRLDSDALSINRPRCTHLPNSLASVQQLRTTLLVRDDRRPAASLHQLVDGALRLAGCRASSRGGAPARHGRDACASCRATSCVTVLPASSPATALQRADGAPVAAGADRLLRMAQGGGTGRRHSAPAAALAPAHHAGHPSHSDGSDLGQPGTVLGRGAGL